MQAVSSAALLSYGWNLWRTAVSSHMTIGLRLWSLALPRERESAWGQAEAWRMVSEKQSAMLETWIHRIAVNAALALVRKQKPGVFEPYETDIATDDRSPSQDLEDFELESDLARQLAGLTDIERVCFVLKHLEQWRAKEIAEELGINDGQVKQAVFRAVKKLRISMQGMRDGNHD